MKELPHGLMQERPLQISSLLTHAAAFSPQRQVVSKTPSGIERYGYREAEERARRWAIGLSRLGVRAGDRVASLAWNTHRHFELFYAVPGIGAILHTLNPRLWEEQLVYILNHAEDRVLCFDPDLIDLVERLAPQISSVEHFVVLASRDAMPESASLTLNCAEDLLADADFSWPTFDERVAAILCYTSGTTGMPKGVLCSHRSTVLHALYAQSAVAFGLTPMESVLLVVPMFHAYGWSLPYVCAIAGAKLVLPGAAPDAQTIVDLIHQEGVSLATGVPTVWTGVFDNLDQTNRNLGPLKRALIGGSAMPPAMSRRLREQYGVEPVTGWGMTELSPLGSFTCATPEVNAMNGEARDAALYGRAGRVLYPLEVKVVLADGTRAPADGATSGDIWVRGPCVASGYYRGEGGDMLDADGWFPTGDVGVLDEFGAIAITDRVKDLIKSGGEWISSADIEKAALDCPGVAQAAAISARHEKWQERPLLLVVASRNVKPTREGIMAAMQAKLAKWQLPDDIVFIEALPLTATGKIDKKVLRNRFGDHLMNNKGGEEVLREDARQ
ncbi:long-chain fatty acid--CoA ligase [Terricaulis sp.]|uniref:long-chain fatty acid--CoA ligase n=1 Tax=Terricaulis sp. TaxID=2768686 RepID=UPI003783F50D